MKGYTYKWALTVVLLVISLVTNAATPKPAISFVGFNPEDGANIEALEFDLIFDISAVIEAQGGATDLGLNCTKTAAGGGVFIYKGTSEETGELIYTDNNTVSSMSDDFQVGNVIHFSYSNVPLVTGEDYTIVLRCNFAVQKKGVKTVLSQVLKYTNDPLILHYKYVGQGTEIQNLEFRSSEIIGTTPSAKAPSVKYSFNAPIQILNNFGELMEGDCVVSNQGSLTIDEQDPNSVMLSFPDSIKLYDCHYYKVALPEGCVALATNDSSVNTRLVTAEFRGTVTIDYAFKSITPTVNDKGFLESLKVEYDVPEGYQFTPTGAFPASIYDSNGNLAKDVVGTPCSSNQVNVPIVVSGGFKPGETYTVKIKASTWGLQTITGKSGGEYKNEASPDFEFTVPSMDEFSVDPIVFGSARLGEHDTTENPDIDANTEIKDMDWLDIKLERYDYEGTNYDLAFSTGATQIFEGIKYYDVTTGVELQPLVPRVSIERCGSNISTRYQVIRLKPNLKFYKGHTYKVVVPENFIGLDVVDSKNFMYRNYVTSPLYELTFQGGHENIEVLECNIPDSTEMQSLGWAMWKLNGIVELKEEYKTAYNATLTSGETVYKSHNPTEVISNNDGTTIVRIDFADRRSCAPYVLEKGQQYDLAFNSDALRCPAGEGIEIAPMKAHITGLGNFSGKQQPVVYTVGGQTKLSTEVTENTAVTFQATPDYNSVWRVGSIKVNGDSVAVNGSTFTTDPITGPTTIDVELVFDGEIKYDFTSETGIEDVIAECPYTVTDTEQAISISGLNGTERVRTYTVGGVLLNDAKATGNNKLLIQVPAGVYIIVINKTTIKFRHN